MSIKNLIKKNNALYEAVKILLRKKHYIEIRYFYGSTLKRNFRKRLNYDLNLHYPQTFCEKIQWLKVNYHNPDMVKCSDKYAVRKYIKDKIGDQYLIELYGVYDSVEEINIDKLPDKFVFKPNHSSGRVIICTDKKSMNWKKEFRKMKRWLNENFYFETGEWQYKDIPPKIICERLLQEDINDYKVFCFNGIPKFTQVISNRSEGYSSNYYDLNWELMDIRRSDHGISRYEIPKPGNYEKMLEISKEISKDFPFVRMDFYEVEGKLFFGETTFTPANGMINYEPKKYDKIFGDYLKLPIISSQIKSDVR
ncbi:MULTISPECIES: ATP-grasp fold amidoligase family protein [unclassified Cytobacillus]|uniref:ATP-grasp fold amidoligase family protein n=1 Tax=unclassified Cytobacillus TaxID=2675268 RepID=UPI00203DD779|nr:ATP-grasp fold amidoligase family protein [Cytobacillus sp. AMY 15.2]MCM3090634.1 glycosyl transferase [Cytobacillus sp. AMY 15.2]